MAGAEEPPVQLKEAAGVDLVRAHCGACHSVDYVQMNSPFLKRAAWEAEVRKMMKVMGAPIPEPEVAPIVDYLTKHYGVE
jgi:mono/diheme cytochrome c family protein